MTLNVLLAVPNNARGKFKPAIAKALNDAGLAADLSCDHAAADVDYIVYAPNGPVQDFTEFVRLKAVLGLWAGVETVVNNPTLTVPMTRMVDSGLQEGMVEWVTGHVLRYHLGLDSQINGQKGVWAPQYPPLARQRRVGILGLGALGGACAKTLFALNFQVAGWSREKKSIAGIDSCHGADGLRNVLENSEILVLLLPATNETENVMNSTTLAMLPKGAKIINPGRGTLIDDNAMLAALNSGQISHATLDVFRTEPLPASDPYWSHESVTVTPHLASETRADTAAALIADNIRRHEDGKPMMYLVDRKAGY